MKFCSACKLQMDTNRSTCVLCGEKLIVLDRGETPFYYPAPGSSAPIIKKWSFLAKLFLFLSIVAGSICLLVNFLTWNGLPWSFIACGGIALAWVLVGVPLLENLNINLLLIFQMTCVQLYVVMIDVIFGRLGWALNYVYPFLYIIVAIAITLFVIIFRLAWREYLITLALMALLGFIPVLFILFGWISVRWPSYAAVMVGIILTYGMFIFAREKIMAEFARRLHW